MCRAATFDWNSWTTLGLGTLRDIWFLSKPTVKENRESENYETLTRIKLEKKFFITRSYRGDLQLLQPETPAGYLLWWNKRLAAINYSISKPMAEMAKIFQVEALVTYSLNEEWLRRGYKKQTSQYILWDSQATIKAIYSHQINAQNIWDCRTQLNTGRIG